jgi:glyoxylate/hydroxypyruvate reductase A
MPIWHEAFKDAGLDADFVTSDDSGDLDNVDYAIVWAPPRGELARFKNLQTIFSIGAGVTHITDDPQAPLHVPIVRLQDEMMVLDMSCHILHWVLHFHRYYYQYGQDQRIKHWQRRRYPENSQCRVSVMGLGQTGVDACQRLADLQFDVTGWSSTAKSIEGIRCLHGDAQFEQLLSGADILINLLPLTPLTENILDASAFAKMPENAFIINCSRGASINDEDLLAALSSGQIRAAALDVFRTEPLPPENPFWEHPAVFITPHAAAPSNERSAAQFIARNIRLCIDGGTPSPIVDLSRGY